MTINYTPKFTPCGLSIRLLKSEARRVAKQRPDLSRRDSLNLVAQRHKYSCWDEITSQYNERRDHFFDRCYRLRTLDSFEQKFRQYRLLNHLNNSAESYRQFVVDLYIENRREDSTQDDSDESTHWDEYLPSNDNFVPGELMAHLQQNGVSGLLPQNLTNELLKMFMVDYKKNFFFSSSNR